MKNVQTLILATGLSSATFALGAKSTEQAYVESYQGRTDMPVPIAVVKPEVPARFAGYTVQVDFIVDEQGAPQRVRAHAGAEPDAELAQAVVKAVAQWRFKPVIRNGTAVSSQVILPVKIVDGFTARGMMVAR